MSRQPRTSSVSCHRVPHACPFLMPVEGLVGTLIGAHGTFQHCIGLWDRHSLPQHAHSNIPTLPNALKLQPHHITSDFFSKFQNPAFNFPFPPYAFSRL